jgi:uncharacterized protein YbjT (DUF2867 family)
MFAITGITGNVGGKVARNLLAANQPVRAVVRDVRKGEDWAGRGCEVVQADITDAAALTAAFQGAEGVFVMVPPNFDPLPDFPEARATAAGLRSALEAARPGRVVYLSTLGAQAAQSNLLTQHSIIEQALQTLPMPITFLRPGWFMENSTWDVAPARESGVIPSFLQPLDKPFPMVATADIGRRRIGRAASRDPQPDRSHVRGSAGPAGENGGRAARDLGAALQIPGHEKSHAAHSHAGRLQRRLDRFRRRGSRLS